MKMKTGYVFKLLPVAALIILLNSCSKDTNNPLTGTNTPPPHDTTTVPTGVVTDVTYGSAVDWKGQSEQLKLDVYMPTAGRTTKKPLIVFIHGGGFLDGDKSSAASFAKLMNDKGFI